MLSEKVEFIRRSRLEIMYNILSLCQRGENKKTHIMYRCNLSFKQVQKYLETLTSMGLLSANQGLYELTEKGEKFLKEFQDLKRLLD